MIVNNNCIKSTKYTLSGKFTSFLWNPFHRLPLKLVPLSSLIRQKLGMWQCWQYLLMYQICPEDDVYLKLLSFHRWIIDFSLRVQSETGSVIRSATSLRKGQRLRLRLADGIAIAVAEGANQ